MTILAPQQNGAIAPFGEGAIPPQLDFPLLAHHLRALRAGQTVQVPIYDFATPDGLQLPRGCRLVGCELVEDAVAKEVYQESQRRQADPSVIRSSAASS